MKPFWGVVVKYCECPIKIIKLAHNIICYLEKETIFQEINNLKLILLIYISQYDWGILENIIFSF